METGNISVIIFVLDNTENFVACKYRKNDRDFLLDEEKSISEVVFATCEGKSLWFGEMDIDEFSCISIDK